jgi:hypothetical protein
MHNVHGLWVDYGWVLVDLVYGAFLAFPGALIVGIPFALVRRLRCDQEGDEWDDDDEDEWDDEN